MKYKYFKNKNLVFDIILRVRFVIFKKSKKQKKCEIIKIKIFF